MKNKIYSKIIIPTLLIAYIHCRSEISEISGKCDKEKKENRRCLISTILTCEFIRSSTNDRSPRSSICNQSDNYLILLTSSCEISPECRPKSEKKNSNNN